MADKIKKTMTKRTRRWGKLPRQKEEQPAGDEEEEEKVGSGYNKKKDVRFIETIIDGYLRGMGTQGATVSAIKNAIKEFKKQNETGWNAS